MVPEGGAMTTPLDELAEYVGPRGPGSKKPCPAKEVHDALGSSEPGRCYPDCRLCGGTGTVLD